MATWPVRLLPKPYRGAKPWRQQQYQEEARLCEMIANWINARGKENLGKTLLFTYNEIALEMRLPRQIVENICLQLDAGGNGFLLMCKDENSGLLN